LEIHHQSVARPWQAGRFAIAFVAYLGLAAVLLRALVAHMATGLPHDLGDPVLSAWMLWWNAHHVPFTSDWWNGPFFYPLRGTLAFSDHRVGLGLFASPVIWLGGGAPLAQNVVLLLTFPLSALSAHLLVWRLTQSHAAGVVAGLIFGFTPYRIAHIEHLELLAPFWIPVALLALHEYIDAPRRKWLAIFAAACVFQGLSSGYYLVYSAPLFAMWAVWFLREDRWRRAAEIGAASGVAALVLAPVLLRYQRIQDALDLHRDLGEIVRFSADVTGLFSASGLLAFWHSSVLPAPEGQIFPGSVALGLFVAAVVGWPRATSRNAWWLRRARQLLTFLLVLWVPITIWSAVHPWSTSVLGAPLAISQPVKPFSIVVMLAFALLVTTPAYLDAFRQRRALAFYMTATVAMWLLALGPLPFAWGEHVITRGPYAVLMQLPGFNNRLRVPARFAMLMVLALSVAAGLLMAQILRGRSNAVRFAATAVLALGIIADGWIGTLPVYTVPPAVSFPPEVNRAAAVFELPFGDPGRDAAAMYHAMVHGRPVVNGYSGYTPAHYQMLLRGMRARDPSILVPLLEYGPFLAVVDSSADGANEATRVVEAQPGVARIGTQGARAFYWIPKATPASPARGTPLPIRAASASQGQIDVVNMTDGSLITRWRTTAPQVGGEEVTLDLGVVRSVTAVRLSLGPWVDDAPRELDISTSADGNRWEDAWKGATGAAEVDAALRDPRSVPLTFSIPERRTRYVRLRQIGRASESSWSIAEASVLGVP